MNSSSVTKKNLFRTLVGQLASILAMVMSEVRDLRDVTDVLQIVIADPDFASKLLGEAQRVTKKVVKFLSFVGTVTVPALTETWNAMDCFKKNLSDNARVKIYEVGRNFQSWFGKALVDEYPGSMLSYYMLTKKLYDREIIAELGGVANVEVTLAEIWFLMEQQGKGEPGALLSDGKANIFYVRDNYRGLRALFVYWLGDGWSIYPFEIDACLWYGKRRFFVRSPRFDSEAVEVDNFK